MTDDNDDTADVVNFDDTLGEILGASFRVTPSLDLDLAFSAVDCNVDLACTHLLSPPSPLPPPIPSAPSSAAAGESFWDPGVFTILQSSFSLRITGSVFFWTGVKSFSVWLWQGRGLLLQNVWSQDSQLPVERLVYGETPGGDSVSAWRIRFKSWQSGKDTVDKPKCNSFEQWLRPRQIALRPLLWEVCCNVWITCQHSR